MNSRLRAIITVVFIAAFFATAPLVLLFTSGYRIDWQHQRVRKTGSIHAETIPQDATVSVQGVGSRRGSPATFGRLLPGEYAVRIERVGYLPWEKRLEVSSGTTTFAVGTVLYRDALPRRTLDRQVLASAWSPDGTDAVVLSEGAGLLELLSIIDGRAPVLLGRFSRESYRDAALTWSPDGRSVLLTGTADGDAHALAYAANAPASAVAAHEAVEGPLLSARWLDAETLAVLTASGAHRVAVATGSSSVIIEAAEVTDVIAYRRATYVLRATVDKAVRVSRLTGDADAPFADVALLPAGSYRFVPSGDAALLVEEPRRGRMRTIGTEGVGTPFEATIAVREPEGDRILLCSQFEIGLLHADGTRELLTRLSTALHDCDWSPERNAALYATDAGVSVIEFDGRDRRVTHELVRFTRVGGIAVDPAARVLRLEGSVGNQQGLFDRDL